MFNFQVFYINFFIERKLINYENNKHIVSDG